MPRLPPERIVGGALLCIGLVSFGVFAWLLRTVLGLERALDVGDVLVLCVLSLFAGFCVAIGWVLARTARAQPPASEPMPEKPEGSVAPSKRVTVSQGCAAAGVLLIILSVLLPAHWYPVGMFFVGLALLAVSHALTPCVERVELLRRARDSIRQL
jgi:hypothetical protein